MDETSDISRLKQISFSIRIVLENLTIEEIFMGFFETNSMTAEALFKIVKDIFTLYDYSQIKRLVLLAS